MYLSTVWAQLNHLEKLEGTQAPSPCPLYLTHYVQTACNNDNELTDLVTSGINPWQLRENIG